MPGVPHRASRAARRAASVLLAVVVCGAAACSGTEAPSGPADPATSGPGATAGSSVPTTADLVDGLLQLEDVRPLPAFGLDTRDQPVLDPQQFSLATLRGPCGATVETPFDESGVFRVFRSTMSLIVEAVAQPGATEADAFVDALRADATAGCAAFTEQLGSAEPSTITLQSMLDLSELGDTWIGWTQEVADSTGRVGFRNILVAAEGDRLWLLAVLSPDPIAADQLVGLGELASDRAAAGTTGS
jgi:hypothetical protein